MIVVNLVGDPVHGLLAESRFVPRTFLPGGEHNMYELAFAAAAAGYDVELRGWLDRTTFDEMRDALGAAPATELPARTPTADDFVVVPEGWGNPVDYARLLLSPARLALFVLAAPGLFGWPFVGPGWSRPDPLTVALDSLAAPVHFAAMAELGFSLLTHSPGLVAAAQAADVACTFVGTGRPAASLPAPLEDGERPVDVVALEANRWAPLARQVADRLSDLRVDLVEEVSNAEVIERMRRARILLWPSRIEGHATIPWEARLVGCVPVALSSNRFAVGLDEESGSVVVDSVSEIAGTARALLSDRARWRSLSARAMTAAREEVDWDRYVDRVRRWADAVPTVSPGRQASGGMGEALEVALVDEATARQTRFEEVAGELIAVREDRDRMYRELPQLRAVAAELERVREDRERLHAQLHEAWERLAELYRNPGVRAALRLEAKWQRLRS